MPEPVDDEFYVGYLERAPARSGRFLRRAVVGLTLAGVGLSAVIALAQARNQPAVFEFGHPREFRGTIDPSPPAALRIPLPGTQPTGRYLTRLMLVAQGKHGADSQLAAYRNELVRLQGTLIYRGAETMVELIPHSVRADEGAPIPPAQPRSLGPVTLTGEIVDAKCHLGVMIPGTGTVHRACAVRCLSGGIPPMLTVIDSAGVRANVWLTGPGGAPVTASLLRLVAEPVKLSGQLLAIDDQLVLEVDPATVTWIH